MDLAKSLVDVVTLVAAIFLNRESSMMLRAADDDCNADDDFAAHEV